VELRYTIWKMENGWRDWWLCSSVRSSLGSNCISTMAIELSALIVVMERVFRTVYLYTLYTL
jgi:hypothetical protein